MDGHRQKMHRMAFFARPRLAIRAFVSLYLWHSTQVPIPDGSGTSRNPLM